MYSEGYKHVTDVKLDSIVVLLDRILLLQELFIATHNQTYAWTIYAAQTW